MGAKLFTIHIGNMYTRIELRPRLWQYWNVKALLQSWPTARVRGLRQEKEIKRGGRKGFFFLKKVRKKLLLIFLICKSVFSFLST